MIDNEQLSLDQLHQINGAGFKKMNMRSLLSPRRQRRSKCRNLLLLRILSMVVDLLAHIFLVPTISIKRSFILLSNLFPC